MRAALFFLGLFFNSAFAVCQLDELETLLITDDARTVLLPAEVFKLAKTAKEDEAVLVIGSELRLPRKLFKYSEEGIGGLSFAEKSRLLGQVDKLLSEGKTRVGHIYYKGKWHAFLETEQEFFDPKTGRVEDYATIRGEVDNYAPRFLTTFGKTKVKKIKVKGHVIEDFLEKEDFITGDRILSWAENAGRKQGGKWKKLNWNFEITINNCLIRAKKLFRWSFSYLIVASGSLLSLTAAGELGLVNQAVVRKGTLFLSGSALMAFFTAALPTVGCGLFLDGLSPIKQARLKKVVQEETQRLAKKRKKDLGPEDFKAIEKRFEELFQESKDRFW